MVLGNAMVMLDSEEFANLSLLLDEYDARAISVEQFSAELAHLLASGNGEKVRTLCQLNIYGNIAASSREQQKKFEARSKLEMLSLKHGF